MYWQQRAAAMGVGHIAHQARLTQPGMLGRAVDLCRKSSMPGAAVVTRSDAGCSNQYQLVMRLLAVWLKVSMQANCWVPIAIKAQSVKFACAQNLHITTCTWLHAKQACLQVALPAVLLLLRSGWLMPAHCASSTSSWVGRRLSPTCLRACGSHPMGLHSCSVTPSRRPAAACSTPLMTQTRRRPFGPKRTRPLQ